MPDGALLALVVASHISGVAGCHSDFVTAPAVLEIPHTARNERLSLRPTVQGPWVELAARQC